MSGMDAELSDERITARELQRNAAEVLDRARNGQSFLVTRRGETVARILPPDPADKAIERAVAAGCSTRRCWIRCPQWTSCLNGNPRNRGTGPAARRSWPRARTAPDEVRLSRQLCGDQALQRGGGVGPALPVAGRADARPPAHELPHSYRAAPGAARHRRRFRDATASGAMATALRARGTARRRV
ncbi:type II toxin-antitoxin system prevent-host-death family antitoxin [Prauserella endophytica]|uniref:Antitoxin n=1 Tax=Prauserella endophytica TaxID=1592324 RepID=A0ABY2RXW0_9PSEU|nr:type II toxin-antitoxin system prevent-host-death family antitoxin [Prauserella endophytica]